MFIYLFIIYLFKKKKEHQINVYSQVRWHHSVFEGCTSKLLFSLLLF